MSCEFSPAVMTDLYEYTMLNASLKDGTANRKCIFNIFARHLPYGRRYGVVAGIGRIAEYLKDFRPKESEIGFLRDNNFISDETAKWLENYHFSGTIRTYREGETYFSQSPIVQVEGTFGECVLLETLFLSVLNYDTSVAAAASRMTSGRRRTKLRRHGRQKNRRTFGNRSKQIRDYRRIHGNRKHRIFN